MKEKKLVICQNIFYDEPFLSNNYEKPSLKSIHGGCVATVIDVCSSFAILTGAGMYIALLDGMQYFFYLIYTDCPAYGY